MGVVVVLYTLLFICLFVVSGCGMGWFGCFLIR